VQGCKVVGFKVKDLILPVESNKVLGCFENRELFLICTN